jgi:hypothetical protein
MGIVRMALALVLIVVFGAGVPFLWIWVGSQLQGGTQPSLSGLGVALAGIVVYYSLLAIVLAWVKERSRSDRAGVVRYAWNRSLSAERYQAGRNTHTLEDIVAAAAIVVGVVCTAAFLLFGNPGVPTT